MHLSTCRKVVDELSTEDKMACQAKSSLKQVSVREPRLSVQTSKQTEVCSLAKYMVH